MKRIVLALSLFVCSTFAFGQVSSETTTEQVVPANTNVVVTVESNAKFVDVEAKKDLFDVDTKIYDLGPENARSLVLKATELKDLQNEIAKAPRRFVFTGVPGKYLVIIQHYDPELGIKKESFTVVIGKPAPKPDPEPNPDPQPDPNPDPDPVPSGLAGKVTTALALVPAATRNKMIDVRQGDGHTTSMKEVVAFGNQFLDIASEASANPNSWDVATMMDELKQRSTSVIPTADQMAWKPFNAELNKALNAEGITASDTAKAIAAFKTVGQVMTSN